mgnify:CR=1 FL=1
MVILKYGASNIGLMIRFGFRQAKCLPHGGKTQGEMLYGLVLIRYERICIDQLLEWLTSIWFFSKMLQNNIYNFA